MRRLLITLGALTLMACQTPAGPTVKPVKPKAKPSATASVKTTASRSPAASVNPSNTPSQAASASASPDGGTSASPTPTPVLDLKIGEQTPDTWVAGPSLQRPRAGAAAASVKETLLVLEGDHRPSMEFLGDGLSAWVLNATQDGPMNPEVETAVPLGISLTTVGLRGDVVFTAGGSMGLGPIAGVLTYNPDGFLGSVGALDLPVKAAAGGIIGNTFYMAGGMGADGGVTNVTQKVDVLNGDGGTTAAMPNPVGGAASAVVGNKLYVLGGYQLDEGTVVPQTSVQVFDPATSSWTTDQSVGNSKPAPLPVARHSAAAAVLNGKIYLVGGSGAGGGMVDVVGIYDPATNTWTAGASLPTPRALLALAAHGDRLWAIGGMNGDGRVMPTVEVYRP